MSNADQDCHAPAQPLPHRPVQNPTHTHIPLLDLSPDALADLSERMKLSLSREDMVEIQSRYRALDREPTDVELEVIAQTWSEHCKHRIFAAEIHLTRGDDNHTGTAPAEIVDSIFKTYVRDVTNRIRADKPGFVISAFDDNAGFIRLDDHLAVCLKAETHNHPSAIEPYAGANTGLGGVIRDILGAGLGAKPVASLDVFCFGNPDADPAGIRGDTIHPIGILRGVVRGVRDYGNRMGIPTVSGAIHFHPGYTYNPLVFCGTAGVIPIADIHKETKPGHLIVQLGARTGRDGLHGATFSSASLHGDSHEEDQGAVQIGNPIEEKKVSDCVLHAREEGLIEDITDCGAGGFSSSCGEMLETTGGVVHLERAKLKQEGLVSWEIFLSESQERMVLAATEANLPRLQELADMYETEMTVLGEATGDGVLHVKHHGETVCELANDFLHDAPRKVLQARIDARPVREETAPDIEDLGQALRAVLGHVNVCSREPIIREYDHEVQGNTLLKPLAGAGGDAPQDAAVIAVDGSEACFAMALSLLPQYGEADPHRMGLSCVDETVRQLVATGADPDRIALLDNYCMGNPEVPGELGKLVECARGMAEAATVYGAPFVSGKDSFYNCYADEHGHETHIPVTFLSSGIGVIDSRRHIVGASLRRAGSELWLLGATRAELGASALGAVAGFEGHNVPSLEPTAALPTYRAYHAAVRAGLVLAAHDCSEGGLAVALAEMGFSLKAGLDIDLPATELTPAQALFSESNARLLVEIDPENSGAFAAAFEGLPAQKIGRSTVEHHDLRIQTAGDTVLRAELADLKQAWKTGLVEIY